MTSPNSTAAYSEGELNKLMDYVKNVTKVGGDHGFAACIIGMSSIKFSLPMVLNMLLRSSDEFLP